MKHGKKEKKSFGNSFRRYVKENSITDRRLGQGKKSLTAADKAGLRYVAQRKHLFKKRDNKFNLNDKDDSLDHLARKMSEREEYKRGIIDQDDEAEIDPEVFAKASFGGGSIKGKIDEEGRKLSRKEILADLIAKSKRVKELRQKEKEVQLDLWEKLDDQFFELKRSGELEFGQSKFVPEDDDYNSLYLQLQEDGNRAVALLPKDDPVKRAEYEAEKNKGAEAERQDRMVDNFINEDHISADYDPGYPQRRVDGQDSDKNLISLHYDLEGKATLKGILKKPKEVDVDWVGSDDEGEMSEESEDEEDDVGEADDDGVEDDEADEDIEDEEEVDDLKDILKDDDDEEVDDADALAEDSDYEADDIEEIEEAAEVPAATTKKAEPIPASVQKIFDDIFTENYIEKSELDAAGKEIFTKASKNPKQWTSEFRSVLSKLVSKRQKNSRGPPEFGEYAFLQLVGNVFSVSDRVHPICAPALSFAMRIITKCRIKGALYCAKILLLCNEIARWNPDSKRYLPEVMAFLLGTLQLATNNPVGQSFPIPVFPVSMPFRQMLFFEAKSRLKKMPPLSVKSIFTAENEGDSKGNRLLDLQVIRLTVRLVKHFAELYDNISEAYPLIFGQFLSLLEKLPADKYPKLLTDEIAETTELVRKMVTERSSFRQMAQLAAKKVKMIEMFECKMDDEWTRKRGSDKEYEKRMKKRANTQKRTAIRDLRRDARSDAFTQHEQSKYESAERIRKTKRIMASLQGQESEYQKRKKMR